MDCEITEGRTSCDESTLTGESAPVEKGPGDTLYSGTINLWGAVEVKAIRPASQSALSRIIEIIREAQQQKAPAQQFTDRFSAWYTYTVLAAAGIMFFVWWLGVGLAPFKSTAGHSAFYRTMTLLVVASPCALVLSIPSAVLSAIAFGAKRGILFRGGSAVERLADVNVVVMDKTGTVTTGDLAVHSIESYPSGNETEVLALAASLEALSTHPLARAIMARNRTEQLAAITVTDFESVPGSGLRALAGGQPLWVGKRDWVLNGETVSQLPSTDSFTEVWVRHRNTIGRIALQDDFREKAAEVIKGCTNSA